MSVARRLYPWAAPVPEASRTHAFRAPASVPRWEAGFFSLSVLDAGQTAVAQRFAHGSSASGWMGLDFHRGAGGAPMLDCALAPIEASVHDVADGGDHQIVIGRTLTVDHPEEHVAPVLFYRGGFAGLS